METVKLNNGLEMPLLGYGVYQITDPVECKKAVIEAINIGYRLIDTAAFYENEVAVGNAIKNCGIPREELFITTKFWVDDAGYEKTKAAFERSLKKMQLDYIDLYLIHQPCGDIFGSWRAMQELYKEGKIKAIGVANFLPERMMDLILNSEVVPAINQLEAHPFCQQIQHQKFLEDLGVQLEAWSPFAVGKNNIFQNELLANIGKKHNKTVAQVILRWLTQRGVVAIPKSANKARIAENFAIFDFKLSEDEMKAIATLDTGKNMLNDHRDPAIVEMLCTRTYKK